MYELIIVVHILSGIAWVGGGLIQQLAVHQARKSGGARGADAQAVALGWMERFIYVPAPVLVLVTGVTMVAVNDAWRFSQPWVYMALGLLVLAGILGGAVGSRLEKRMESLREEGQVESAEFSRLLTRALTSGWVELVVMVALVVLMVYKPGA